jgi:hypothetical protein
LIYAAVFALQLTVGTSAPAPRLPDQQPPLAVWASTEERARAVLRVGAVLGDPALEEVTRSGLPIRVRARVELWRDGFIDNLEASETWATVLLFEPLERQYIVRPTQGPASRYTHYADARAAIESEHPLRVAPRRSGRYYYTAVLEIETLSLSDLDELERWLQGELGPAVSGRRSLSDAVGEGAKRLLIRLLGLPTRRVEAKSDRFRVE